MTKPDISNSGKLKSTDDCKVKKPNCWEVMKCELGPGGTDVAERGICPAATNTNLDGVNDGENGGRSCWAVRDTLCQGEGPRNFVSKCLMCMNCKFYIQTYKEIRFPAEKSTVSLLKKALGEERD